MENVWKCFISLDFISIQKNSLKAHGPSVSGQETAVSICCTSNLSFRQSQLMKFENLTFSPARRNFTQFFLGWIGNQELVFPQTFHGPSVSQVSSPTTVFGWTNVPFRQKKPIKFEFSTLLARFNEIGRIFLGLNWKPSVSFSLNFPWSFSVTRWNSCHSFWLNQCTF